MRNKLAFSLVEMLIVVAIIGVISAVALPIVSMVRESSNEAKNLANAKNIERMSGALASLGVAHVIPDSLGGVEATARLLREGVIVPDGPMAGETFSVPGLGDEDIRELSEFLQIHYDMSELRLVFSGRNASAFQRLGDVDITTLCVIPVFISTNQVRAKILGTVNTL